MSGLSRTLLGVVIVMLVCAASVARAQVSGTVTGSVKDARGGVIPGASVVLVSESRGTQIAPVVTTGTGDFVTGQFNTAVFQGPNRAAWASGAD